MDIFGIIRRLTIPGAVVLIFSFMMPWEVLPLPDGEIVGGGRPIPVLIVGLALLILSVIPALPQWRKTLAVVLVAASGLAAVITLWSLTRTILQVSQVNLMRFGAGPIVALVGNLLFVIGALAFMQSAAAEPVHKPDYKIVNLPDIEPNRPDLHVSQQAALRDDGRP